MSDAANEDDFTHYFNATARLSKQVADLTARLASAEADLADALDLKAGNGPTVLTRLVEERDTLKAVVEQAREEIKNHHCACCWNRTTVGLAIAPPKGPLPLP